MLGEKGSAITAMRDRYTYDPARPKHHSVERNLTCSDLFVADAQVPFETVVVLGCYAF